MAASGAVVSCFVADNEQGDDLLWHLKRVLRAVNAEMLMRPPDRRQVEAAIAEDDAVVFDGSIERGHLYKTATSLLGRADHVLIVGRTAVAANLRFMRDGGAPTYGRGHTNGEIAQWVDDQLRAMSLPRQRGNLRDSSRQRLNREGQVFISYRSTQLPIVVDLQSRIKRGLLLGVRGRSAFYYGPGALAFENELLPELRCWAINAVIRSRILAADELLVVNSGDYLGSWWTTAEIMMVALARQLGRPSPRIVVYDPNRSSVRPEPPGFVPVLSPSQMERMRQREESGDRATFAEAPKLLVQVFAPGHPSSSQFQDDAIWRCPRIEAVPEHIDVDGFLSPGTGPRVMRYPMTRLNHLAGWTAYKCPGCGKAMLIRCLEPRHWWDPSDGSLRPLAVYTAEHNR